MTAFQKISTPRSCALMLFALVSCLLSGGCAPYVSTTNVPQTESRLSGGYSDLDQFGRWTSSVRYGDVWCPTVSVGWTPFSDGSWAWTDQGWFWSSNEPFGWLVFHYGSWCFDDQLGWCWMPGETWSAAPVRWAVYDGNVCWAPLSPPNVVWPDPWAPYTTRVWNVAPLANFTESNPGRFQTQVVLGPPTTTIVRRAPEIAVINKSLRQPLVTSKVVRRPTTIGAKRYDKATITTVTTPPKTQPNRSAQAKPKTTVDDKKPEKKKPADHSKKPDQKSPPDAKPQP